ncbi:hypothetical protein BdWA1_002203 [Babesia duncani]|uniref:Uncharacterized protein n=1 Tax=Babesia duncani TaxID=323732 RepID=A0AAD9PLH7_9APIC|nr:hypothetical protein BdWA1_002203 [Babesia duncani]
MSINDSKNLNYLSYRKRSNAADTLKINPKSISHKTTQGFQGNDKVQSKPSTSGCGRIVCCNHGEGPCTHCGTMIVAVDSNKIPSIHLNSPEFQRAINLKNELLKVDEEYQSQSLKVHDLHAGWFEEAQDIYNPNRDFARKQWQKQENERLEEAGNLIKEFNYLCRSQTI